MFTAILLILCIQSTSFIIKCYIKILSNDLFLVTALGNPFDFFKHAFVFKGDQWGTEAHILRKR